MASLAPPGKFSVGATDYQRCHFWCYNIRFDVFRNFFDVWCLRYKFDVDNNFHIVSKSFTIFHHFSKIVYKLTGRLKLRLSFDCVCYCFLFEMGKFIMFGKQWWLLIITLTVLYIFARLNWDVLQIRGSSLFWGQCVSLTNLVKATVKRIMFVNWHKWFTLAED